VKPQRLDDLQARLVRLLAAREIDRTLAFLRERLSRETYAQVLTASARFAEERLDGARLRALDG
jgi:hypothetical protein